MPEPTGTGTTLDEVEAIDNTNFDTEPLKSGDDLEKTENNGNPVISLENEEPPKAPDGGYGWFIVLGSCLVHAIMGGFERSNGVIYLQLLDKFDNSATATAWVLSIFSTLRLAVGPVASALCNKYSCRTVVIMGAAISTLGIFLSGFVPALPYLYLTYGVLGGIGRAFAYTPSLIIVGYYFNKKRGIAVGISTSGVGIGCMIFPPVIEVLFTHYGFRGTFWVLSALMSHFFICGCLFRSIERHREIMESDRKIAARREALPNDEPKNKLLTPVSMETKIQNQLSNQNAAKLSTSMKIIANAKINSRRPSFFTRKFSQVKLAIKGSNNKKGGAKKPLLELHLFRNYAFTAICVQLFLFTLSFNSTFVFLPALAETRGISKMEGAFLVSILGMCDGIARIVMSSILDLKKVKPYRLWIYNSVMFLTAIVSLIMPSVKSFYEFAIISAFYGVLSGTYISQKSVIVVDVLGVEKLSSSVGLLLLFQGVSGLIGPTVGGVFKDELGSYDMAFYFGSIGIISGGLTMLSANIWMYRQKKKKAARKDDSDKRLA
ncbi:hypothetical protein ACF0H5_022165 [Mactra antiquata]